MFDRLKNYQRPVLLFSAGLDSTLLLTLLIESHAQFDIVTFGREFWTREQKKRADAIIKAFDLKVFSYPPSNVSFIGDGEQIGLVREYAFMGATMPMVNDVIDGQTCIADLDGHRAYQPPMKWDLVLIGSRKDDKHYAFEHQVIPDKMWTIGQTTFWAPFYDKSREWVKAELTLRGLDADEVDEQADSGNISLCHSCLHGVETYCPKENSIIPPIQWEPARNLAAFRAAYGFQTK